MRTAWVATPSEAPRSDTLDNNTMNGVAASGHGGYRSAIPMNERQALLFSTAIALVLVGAANAWSTASVEKTVELEPDVTRAPNVVVLPKDPLDLPPPR